MSVDLELLYFGCYLFGVSFACVVAGLLVSGELPAAWRWLKAAIK